MRMGVEPGARKASVDSVTLSLPVIVAIVDSGIMVNHPDLREQPVVRHG